MKKLILKVTVFIAGAVTMMLELVGVRILTPYFGASSLIWTGLIGIILASLSLGYWIGGKLADKKSSLNQLSLIVFIAGMNIALISILKEPLLLTTRQSIKNIYFGLLFDSLILLAPPSVLLGTVTPYAAKLSILSLKKTGSTIGNLYAISTIGSIMATFLTGFILLPSFGNTKILILTSLILITNSIAIYQAKGKILKITGILVSLFLLLYINKINLVATKEDFIDIDSQYNRVWIYKTNQKSIINKPNPPMIVLSTGGTGFQTAFPLGGNQGLISEYLKSFGLAKSLTSIKSALMIGGGGYSYVKEFLSSCPRARLDVVEIDSKLTQLAKKFFGLTKNRRLEIFHEDGRVFLAETDKKYDAIFIDAFNSLTPPYHLLTKEFLKSVYKSLNDNGVVMTNTISAVEGEKGRFLRSSYFTYKIVFNQVTALRVNKNIPEKEIQNIVIIGIKNSKKNSMEALIRKIKKNSNYELVNSMTKDVPILTDDYSPADFYALKIFQDMKSYSGPNYLAYYQKGLQLMIGDLIGN